MPSALIGDFAAGTGSHLAAFLRAEHAGAVTMSDMGETDFAVIVYREEDQWEADALPAALTADLDGLVAPIGAVDGTAHQAVLGAMACGYGVLWGPGFGYPLTQLVVRRWGVRGAAVAECVCAGLAIRDASMVASGIPARLRRFPASLLRLELAVGVVASLAGSHSLLGARSAVRSAARCSAPQ